MERREERKAKGSALLDSKHTVHPEIINWKCQRGQRKNSRARSKQEEEREMGEGWEIGND